MVAKTFIVSNFLFFDCIKSKPIVLSNIIATFFLSNSLLEIVPASTLARRNLSNHQPLCKPSFSNHLVHPPENTPNSAAKCMNSPQQRRKNTGTSLEWSSDPNPATSDDPCILGGHLMFITKEGKITSFDYFANSIPPYGVQYLAPLGPEYDVESILFDGPFDIRQYRHWVLNCKIAMIRLRKGKTNVDSLHFLNGFCRTLYPYLLQIQLSELQSSPKMQIGSVSGCQTHLVVKSLCVPCYAGKDITRANSVVPLLRALVGNMPPNLKIVDVKLSKNDRVV